MKLKTTSTALRVASGLVLLGISAWPVLAQWTTQTITLRPGWNAVFVEIQPEPEECDSVFSGLPVESVWSWTRRFSSVQFIQDPSTLIPGQPDWLTWVPAAQPARATMNLFTIGGGRAYLVKLPGNATATNWQIKGRALMRQSDWISDSLNLVGFQINGQIPPTFQQFFAASPAHVGQPIYRLNTAGQWVQLANPASASMQSGEAFWIRCKGQSTFSGPLNVLPEQGAGLDYGRILTELRLRIRNDSTVARTFTIRQLASETPINATYPDLAGPVPLSYFKMILANNEYGWVQLPSPLQQMNVPPRGEWELRLGVRRVDMTLYTPSPGSVGGLYQSLLEVSDNLGGRRFVPVIAQGLQSTLPASALTPAGVGKHSGTPEERAGLWVGSAVIKKVNQPANISQPNTPIPAATEFQFRLIVHLDGQGQPRLLQKVLQMWKNGTTKPDPTNPNVKVVDVPGRFVLLADDALIPNFTGAALRDGEPVGRRISSGAFGFRNPIPLTGTGNFGANILSCSVILDYDDSLNPFRHGFHPDHNNFDERYEQKLPEGIESFSITRQIQLEFTSTDPDGFALAGWGDTQLGGNYRETITGLHNRTLYLEGTFRLHHVSRVPVLNDQ